MSGRANHASAEGFFNSRWVDVPAHVTPLAGGLPAGFRAAGVACGIKPGGDLDLGLMVSDAPATTSAARFTRSATPGAPVQLTRTASRTHELRAVVANSGNANAVTGESGVDDAAQMQTLAASAIGIPPDAVAVASTGVIGVPLPMEAVRAGIAAAAGELRPDREGDFACAIRTTDALAKQACLEVELRHGVVRIAAQAKGAGMISPGFATLLCFVQSDAALDADTCELLLGVTVKRSFERVSVDGQLSTSDMVILQCSGQSGVEVAPETEDELRFGEALDALLRQLALVVVRDGEGARRVGRIAVSGGAQGDADAVARAIANSPLVKTALYGGDPNWGRIVQAAGAAMGPGPPLAIDVAIEGIPVCVAGSVTPHDVDALHAAVQGREVLYEVTLPGGGAETEVFFSDLGHEYVTINAEYTT